jgi:hypothetical protein
MTLHERLNEIMPDVKAPSSLIQHEAEYVRREYFADGAKLYFSPLDFALNGPDEGSTLSRKDEHGRRFTVKVLKKHYEEGEEVPSMVEVEATITTHGRHISTGKLWVIVRATDTTITKFKLRLTKGVTGYSFALFPDFYIHHNVRMNHHSPTNEISEAFSTATGIPINYLVLKDLH